MTYGLRSPVLLAVAAAALVAAGCSDEVAPRPDAGSRDTAVDHDGPAVQPTPDAGAPDTGAPDTSNGVADAAAPADGPEGSDAVASDDGGAAGDDAAPEPDAAEPTPDAGPLAGPLLGYWKLDDLTGTNAADSSPNGEEATLEGGAMFAASGFTAATFPNAGSVTLDGTTGFVELPTRAFPAYGAAKTISVWFNPSTPTRAGRQNLIALTSDDGGIQMGLDTGKVTVWLSQQTAGLVVGTANVTAAWHHFAYTFDGTTHRLFLDGQLVGMSAAPPQGTVATLARIGSFDLNTENFAGGVDDLRVYDSALDMTRIAALAAGQD
jgi:hypothetical protein